MAVDYVFHYVCEINQNLKYLLVLCVSVFLRLKARAVISLMALTV